jgi:hypothetical protein
MLESMGRRACSVRVLGVAAICVSAALAAAPAASSARSTVPAKVWTKNFCSSIGSWVTVIQQRTAAYNKTLNAWKVNGHGDIARIRGFVVDYVSDATVSTDAMVRKVKSSGPPAVRNGALTHRQVGAALDQVSAVFHRALTSARALPRSDALLFIRKASALAKQITTGLDGVGSAFNAIGRTASPALETAAKSTAACQSIG